MNNNKLPSLNFYKNIINNYNKYDNSKKIDKLIDKNNNIENANNKDTNDINKDKHLDLKTKKNLILYGTHEDNLDINKYNMSFTMRRNYFLNNLLARNMTVFHSSIRNLFLISNVGIVFYGFGHTIKDKQTSILIKIVSLITLILGLFYIYNIYIEYMIYHDLFYEHKEIIIIGTFQGIKNYSYIVIFYAIILLILIILIIYNLTIQLLK